MNDSWEGVGCPIETQMYSVRVLCLLKLKNGFTDKIVGRKQNLLRGKESLDFLLQDSRKGVPDGLPLKLFVQRIFIYSASF